jgi:hypothetical protein
MSFFINTVLTKLIGVEGVRSCGRSGTGETPQVQCTEEAHRQPRGKRVPGMEINSPI